MSETPVGVLDAIGRGGQRPALALGGRLAQVVVAPTIKPKLFGAQVSAGFAVICHPNDAYAESLERAISPGNCEVIRCADKKALRQCIFARRPALLVTELRLPDGPVIELLKWLRANSPQTRIVVITAHDSVATAVRCMRLGVNAYYSEREPLERVLGVDDFAASHRGEPEQPLRLDRALWEYVNRVVDQAGSITRAADVLGLDRRSLRRMLGKYAPPP